MSDARDQADRNSAEPAVGSLGLYVHIPFCETKCPYCDFNTYEGIDTLIPGYTAALCREIGIWGQVLGHPAVETVFFGGGTPSYLPTERIESVIESIGAAFDVDPKAEVTLETNPDDLTPSKLSTYLKLGINRLSIGVQTLKDDLLKTLGRRHSAAQAAEAYRMAQSAGFTNVSIDLMYGLPYQRVYDWERTLGDVGELSPPHVSMYCLTLEEGTPMAGQIESGGLPEPDPDLAAEMYLMAQEVMEREGYGHYEISNWARPGFESRHNLVYWRNRPYLGVGPGAHSYLGAFRFFNIRSPAEYVRRLGSGLVECHGPSRLTADSLQRMPGVAGVEAIDRRLEMAETMMMGLRLEAGIDSSDFTRRFGSTPEAEYGAIIGELAGQGLLDAGDGVLKLTPRGRMLGNEVFARFLAR